MKLEEALWQDAGRVSGAVCFRGTRIPVAILFDCLSGEALAEFFENYPGATEEQVATVIECASKLIEAQFPGATPWR